MVDFNVLKKDIMDKLNISENEFEELVNNRIKEYGGLLNQEASIVVIHREVCRNEDNIKTTEPVHNDENINNNAHTNDEDHN